MDLKLDLKANQHPPEQAIPPPGRRQLLREARAKMEAYPASHFHELPGRSNVIWSFMDYNKCAPWQRPCQRHKRMHCDGMLQLQSLSLLEVPASWQYST